MMINQAAGEMLREVHEAVNTSVLNGDPTPFKRFRRQEFLTTLELMGNMPDTAPVDEILREEITLTEEAFELVQWLKERRALILCLSDKPDEASKSSSRYAVDMPPLHQAETHRIGVSILDTLSQF
jgi:phosphoserine phosphatase